MNINDEFTDLLFKGNTLEKIAYSDKPLPQNGEVIYLNIEEFERMFNFTYSESLYGDRKQLKDYFNIGLPPDDLPESITSKDIKYRLMHPLNCFVVCNLGPTGHGLFSREDIPPYTVLFAYTGTVCTANINDGVYDYVWFKTMELPWKMISARRIGGLARFMQHLPLDDEKFKQNTKQFLAKLYTSEQIQERGLNLDDVVNEEMQSQPSDYELRDNNFRKQSVRNSIQSCNVERSHVKVDGIPMVICWTQFGIKKNEQLGFPYGENYWNGLKKLPRYYREDGTLIPFSDYNHISNTGMFGKINPYKLYSEGVEKQKQGSPESALIAFSRALNEFRIKTNKTSIECGNCYAALASSYRDTKDYFNAIVMCEKAISIFFHLKEEGKLNKIRSKYLECLKLYDPNPSRLYAKAQIHFKSKKYIQAIDSFEFIISGKNDDKLTAYCHAELAACYRALNKCDLAILHYQAALEIMKKIRSDPQSIEVLENKLSDLKLTAEKTTTHVYP